MASNYLLMSFSIFIITLSVRFFLSLNCSACNKSFSFFSYVSFFITQKPKPLSNGTASRPLSFKYFLAFSTPSSEGVCFAFLAYLFAAAAISHIFLRVFYLVQFRQKTINVSKEVNFIEFVSYRMFWSKT